MIWEVSKPGAIIGMSNQKFHKGVVEQQFVGPWLKAPAIEPTNQVTETGLNRVPKTVYDVGVDARRWRQ